MCGDLGNSFTLNCSQRGGVWARIQKPEYQALLAAAYVTLGRFPLHPSLSVNFPACSCPAGCSEHQRR